MKPIKSVIATILSLLLAGAACASVSAVTIYQYNGYSYRMLANNNISLCGWDNRSSELVVPEYLEDSVFTEIDNFGLMDNQEISVLDLSQAGQLQVIGLMAFKGCSGISNDVEIPGNVSVVGSGAFQDCTSMSGVIYTAQVDTVYAQTFYRCSSLKNVRLPDSLQKIEKFAFGSCTSLERLDLPRNVNEIDSTAFYNDVNLTLGVWYDTYAHRFAQEQNMPYVLLDGVLLGDANADEKVDVADVTVIQQYIAELAVLDGIYLKAADVNNDGDVNIADATAIQMYVAEYESVYPIGEAMTQ